jgi:predicted RNA binding protein YcfA (HicA-like mRNA interferase family)
MKFPVDAPRSRVVKALQLLGFQIVREREHIAMRRTNADGTTTPLTLPQSHQLKELDASSHLHAGANSTRGILARLRAQLTLPGPPTG